MRACLFVLLVSTVLAGCSDSSSPSDKTGTDAAAPLPLVVNFVFRTDFVPGREFDSYQLELGAPGEILRSNDCATEDHLIARTKLDAKGNPVEGGERPDFAGGVVLKTVRLEELPLEARVLLCKDGEFVGALVKQAVPAGEDAGMSSPTVIIEFRDAGADNSAKGNEIDVTFSIARDRSFTCDGSAPPACVEQACAPLPVLRVPHDERCKDSELCDPVAGCIDR